MTMMRGTRRGRPAQRRLPDAVRLGMGGILFIIAVAAGAPAAPAAEWYYVVDANRGATNGPFHLRNHDEIRIDSNEYQIVEAPPLFGIEERTIAKVDARCATPEAVLRKAWAEAVPTNHPLPELLFLNIGTNVEVTLRMQQVDLAVFLSYVCDAVQLRASRLQIWSSNRLQDLLIVEPATMHDDRETQVYFVRPEFYDLMIKAHCTSLKEWLMQLGAFQKESEAQVLYLPAKNWLIIRAPHDVQEMCSRTIEL